MSGRAICSSFQSGNERALALNALRGRYARVSTQTAFAEAPTELGPEAGDSVRSIILILLSDCGRVVTLDGSCC